MATHALAHHHAEKLPQPGILTRRGAAPGRAKTVGVQTGFYLKAKRRQAGA